MSKIKRAPQRAKEYCQRLRAAGFRNTGTPYDGVKDGQRYWFRADDQTAILYHVDDARGYDTFTVLAPIGYNHGYTGCTTGALICDLGLALQIAQDWLPGTRDYIDVSGMPGASS